MPKTMRVTLEIVVDDLPAEKRKDYADGMEMDATDLPSLKDTPASEAAAVLENFGGDMNDDLFAGSDTYVHFTDVRVLSAEYVS